MPDNMTVEKQALLDLYGALDSAFDTGALKPFAGYQVGCDCMACLSVGALLAAQQQAEQLLGLPKEMTHA